MTDSRILAGLFYNACVSLVSRYLQPEVVARLGPLALSGRRIVEGAIAGTHRSPIKGASVEFHQHRAYVHGDEPRRLDWRVLGRTDRPYVREYNEETNLRAMILLDCSGSMAYGGDGAVATAERGSKFDYAAKVVAALAYLMLGQTESVGITAATQTSDPWIAPASGTAQLARIIEVLERSDAVGKASIGAAMQRLAERLGRRSMAIVVSDLLAPVAELRQGLSRLHHGRHEIVALRILHPDEIEFPFGSWRRFTGLEHEPARLLEPAMMRQTYLDNFARHQRELETSCAALGVELHELRTDRPVAESLIGFLRHRDALTERTARR